MRSSLLRKMQVFFVFLYHSYANDEIAGSLLLSKDKDVKFEALSLGCCLVAQPLSTAAPDCIWATSSKTVFYLSMCGDCWEHSFVPFSC